MGTATKLTEVIIKKITAQNIKEGINNTPSTKEAQMEKLEEDWRLQLCFSFENLLS